MGLQHEDNNKIFDIKLLCMRISLSVYADTCMVALEYRAVNQLEKMG
jgi:hypothetical protein